MKALIVALLIILLPTQSIAYEVKYLEQGAPAPFSGFLFTKESERQLRELDQSVALYEKKIELLQKQQSNYEQISELSMKKASMFEAQADKLSKELAEQRSNDFWRSALYFGAGAILTGFIAYGYSRAIR